jgi:hypothetical protein
MNEIVLKEVKTRRDKREFIYLPEKIHKNDPTWLPPLYIDEWELFDEKKNKSYQYSEPFFTLPIKTASSPVV